MLSPKILHGEHPGTVEHRASLGDDVYEALLSRIISLKIQPRERMSVDALARDLGVSQTPIRAALIRLETEGLVVKKHNSGFSAAPMPSGETFRQIYELRQLLEPAATASTARRGGPELLRELEELHHTMQEVVREHPVDGYGKFAMLDARFHALIADASGNPFIASSLDRLYTHLHLFRLRYHSTVTEDALIEHEAILEALRAGDADAAHAAMARHIETSRQRMEPYFETLED
ncbi:MAG: GntR family transcriptional regulator [Xanthobacter sp.]